MEKLLKIIIGLFISLLTTNLSAQPYYTKPEEYIEMKSRILLVELLDINDRQIKNWEKKIVKTEDLEKKRIFENKITEHKEWINNFNNNLKVAVEKFWDFNAKIEYKQSFEVEKIRKSKIGHGKYSVLWLSDGKIKRADNYLFNDIEYLTMPELNYSRIEQGYIRSDYYFNMPYTAGRWQKEAKVSDFIISFKLMKANIDYNIKHGKSYDFVKYVKEIAKENCKSLIGENISMNENNIHKELSLDEINNAYSKGKVVKYTDDEMSKLIEKEENIIVGLSIPYGALNGENTIIRNSTIVYLRCYININTAKIFTNKGTGIYRGELSSPYFRKDDFSNPGPCE